MGQAGDISDLTQRSRNIHVAAGHRPTRFDALPRRGWTVNTPEAPWGRKTFVSLSMNKTGLLTEGCESGSYRTERKCVVLHVTCSLSSASWLDSWATSATVVSNLSCSDRISFCSLSPSELTKDMARILGNQSRFFSWKKGRCEWYLKFYILFNRDVLVWFRVTSRVIIVLNVNINTSYLKHPGHFKSNLLS